MVKIVHDDRSLSMRESLAVRVLLTVIDDYCPEVYMPEHRLQRIRNMTAAENICRTRQLELFYEIAGVLLAYSRYSEEQQWKDIGIKDSPDISRILWK